MKQYFNHKLYVDGLKQLRAVGIMGAVILLLPSFFVPFMTSFNESVYQGVKEIHEIHFPSGVWYVFAILFIGVPIMMFQLMGFLNRRNACDYYHALPIKREGLALSFLASVLTWNMGLYLMVIVVNAITCMCCPYVSFQWEGVFVGSISFLMSTLFVMSGIYIGMSVTGNLMSNIAVSAMVIVVPRLLITAFLAVVIESVDTCTFELSGTILDDRLNTLTNMVTGPIMHGEYTGLHSWLSILYTLVISVLYLLLGTYFMKKRPSESASYPATSKRAQLLFRLTPATLFALIPTCLLFASSHGSYDIDAEEFLVCIILYIIAVVIYAMYELITTRRLINVFKSLKGLIFLVIFQVAFFLLACAGREMMLNDIPEPSSVKYMTLNMPQILGTNYYSVKMATTPYDNENLKTLLCNELRNNNEVIRQKKDLYDYFNYMGTYYPTNFIPEFADIVNDYNYQTLEVHFKNKGFGTKSKTIYLSQGSLEYFLEYLVECPETTEVLQTRFAREEVKDYDYNSNTLSLDQIYDIYCSYMDELNKMPVERQLMYLYGYARYGNNLEDVWKNDNAQKITIYTNGASLNPDFADSRYYYAYRMPLYVGSAFPKTRALLEAYER